MKQDYNHIIIRNIRYHFKVVFTLGFWGLLLFSGCVKDSETKPEPFEPKVCETCLPEITTSGKNTFGCRVNGKIWLPLGGWMSTPTRLDYFKNELTIVGYNDERQQYVNLSLSPILDTGYYDFSSHQFAASRVLFDEGEVLFSDNPVKLGHLRIIRFDLKSGIISGTFAFDASNDEGDTVHITDGRFDLHF